MNKAYINKRFERARQILAILYARPDFQAHVVVFRKKWNIPKDGIKSEENNHKWLHWFNDETKKYVDKHLPVHRKQMDDLFKLGKLIERDDLNKKFNTNIPRNAFRHEVLFFLATYKIPMQWEELIRRYLLFNNNIDQHIGLNSVTVQAHWDFDMQSWQLSLLLSADATLDDIKAMWPLVMEEQKKLYDYTAKKFQPIYNLKIDQKVHELKQQKLSHAKIAEKINKEFRLSKYTYKDVSESLRHHKKRLGLL